MLELSEVQVQQGRFNLTVGQWQCRPGELHVLLGCNGAGKSTLLRCLAAELPHSGLVRLHGHPLRQWDALRRARHLGVLPQSSHLSFGFSAAEVVALGATPLRMGRQALQGAITAVMEQTDCATLAEQAYPSLSGGERQRVQLARVLLQLRQAEQPPFLLLDEPTSAQDLQQQHQLLGMIRALAEKHGYGVIAILHDLNNTLRYAHSCSVLHQGRVACHGTPRQVLTPETVARHWQYQAQCLTNDDGLRVLV